MNDFERVRAFHAKFGVPEYLQPSMLAAEYRNTEVNESNLQARIAAAEDYAREIRLPGDVFCGRVQMMLEELRELCQAHADRDIPGVADALVDLVYFALGTAAMMGLPWEACFAEVHRANMEKIRVKSAAESRRFNKLDVRKPEGWYPPNLKAILGC